MKQLTDCVKGYVIPHQAWGAKNEEMEENRPCPRIEVGIYCHSGGTLGEFLFVWEELGIRLRAYEDSWEVLGQMPELIRYMARISRKNEKVTVEEFAKQLKRLGYEDFTERVRPKNY